MPGQLQIVPHGDFARLVVSRDDALPEVVWSRVVSEWGTEGPDPASRIHVPVERFLSHLGWLRSVCIRHKVGIEWDDQVVALVKAAQSQRLSLDGVITGAQQFNAEQVLERLSGSRFARELRDFQKRDLGKLLALPNGANFSVPGAGKTAVTYALYEAERKANRVERLLVVAPLSAFESWMTESTECFERPPVVHRYDGGEFPERAEVCLVNYQRLAAAYEQIAGWVAERPCHVVLDEAHRMKRGWAGEWGRSALNLAYLAVRRDVLTGTPAPQGMRDVEALLDFAWPGQARRIIPSGIFERFPPPNAPAAVADAIRPLFARTKKSELGLPLPKFEVVIVPLEGLQRQIYQALRNEYAGLFPVSRRERSDFAKMGEVVMYLLEAATNPQLLPAGGSQFDEEGFRHPPLAIPQGSPLSDLIAAYGRYETPRKFVQLGMLLKANAEAGRKTLVWTNFVRNILTLERMLARYRPAIIHGGIPSNMNQPRGQRTREGELLRFRENADCAVLLANPAATSEGISLHHHCHDAIYVDRTFNAGQYLQSVDRIHRLGMEDVETRITFLITADTVDQVVDQRIRDKSGRLG